MPSTARQCVVVFLMSVAVSGLVVEAADRSRLPNILFAFADDWGRYASAYAKLEPGGPSDAVSTPHFDRIASVPFGPSPAAARSAPAASAG